MDVRYDATIEELLPLGELSLLMLLALRRGASHGYAIGKEVEEHSDGRLKPTTGARYQALRRLQSNGLLEPAARPDPSGDARRKYFRLTRLGREALDAETARLERLVAAARAGALAPTDR